jgi:hypothetical protein
MLRIGPDIPRRKEQKARIFSWHTKKGVKRRPYAEAFSRRARAFGVLLKGVGKYVRIKFEACFMEFAY